MFWFSLVFNCVKRFEGVGSSLGLPWFTFTISVVNYVVFIIFEVLYLFIMAEKFFV